MSFIAEDDHVILMDISGSEEYRLTPRDLKRLRDVGCQTALEILYWNEVERERGKRDWSCTDAIVERVTQAGLKVLLSTYHHPPPAGILPVEWYQQYSDGRTGSHFSLWNQDAQAYEHEFIGEARARYESDQVKCINSLQADGETVLQLKPCYYDPAAMESHGPSPMDEKSVYTQGWVRDKLIETLLDQSDVFGGDEMWLNMHPTIRSWFPAAGNQYIEDIYRAFRKQRPETELWTIQFTYFPHGRPYRNIMTRWREQYDLNIIGGAEHCHGITRNTPLAIEDGIRLLVGPTHPFTEKKRVDDQMLETIANSIERMRGGRP